MIDTELINPPHPGKLDLIEQFASHVTGPWRFIDIEGVGDMDGGCAFHALTQPGCMSGTEVDTRSTSTFLEALAAEPRLTYVDANFRDAEVIVGLPPFNVVFLFDILPHQVRPNWNEILSMYASRASHVLIFNPQYSGDHTIRLLDQQHPACERTSRDVHQICQWGIANDDLIATMAVLGFELVFNRNWGQVPDLELFENQAFIFSRAASRPNAPIENKQGTENSIAKAQEYGQIMLPDHLSALGVVEDDGTLVNGGRGERLRLLRSLRRVLQHGSKLRIKAVDDAARTELIDDARYAGFTNVINEADFVTLRLPDRSLTDCEVPLVTIAIPAFKPEYFATCLESALAQTYPRLQILVCDDSADDELRQIADRHIAAGRVEWISNRANIGGLANTIQCLEQARGDFIKFLCDDDVLEPSCVETMVAAFRRDPDATLVFSRRQRIDGQGQPLPDDHHTEAIAEHDCVFRGEALAGAVIALQANFIGEPTTVLFRKADLAWIRPHYAAFDGHDDIRVVCDIAAWHNLLSQGEAVYIARPLSRFRIHADQGQQRPEIRKLIPASWSKLERGSRSLGFAQQPHPPVPHREPGERAWKIDLALPLNRRLAARANGATVAVEPLAETVIRLVDEALTPPPSVSRHPDPASPADRQRYEAAIDLRATGNEVAGIEALIELAASGSPLWEVYADLAETALEHNDQPAAMDLMQAAATRAPNEARAVLGAAMLQFSTGNFETALSTLSPFLRLHPNDTEALTLVRDILSAMPELSAITWARLVADLRHEAATLRTTLSRHDETMQTLRATASAALTTSNTSRQKVDAPTDVAVANERQEEKILQPSPAWVVARHLSRTFCPVCEAADGGFRPLPDHYRKHAEEHGFKYFGRGEMTAHETYFCAQCGASDRERLYAYWVSSALCSGDLKRDSKVIHFAPEPGFSRWMRTIRFSDYQTADIAMPDVDHQVDLMKLPFASDSVDFFVCSHVLEHVIDDATALAELFRILKPGSMSLLMVPIICGLDEIDEDVTEQRESERWRRFGQDDHLRLYNREAFISRVLAAGFNIRLLDITYFGSATFQSLGLKNESVLYVVAKPDIRDK